MVLTVSSAMVMSFIYGRQELFFTQVFLVILTLGLFLELLYFVNNTNRRLYRFLIAVKEGDYTANFHDDKLSSTFSELNELFMELLQTIKNAKLEKEAQYLYLNKIINHIDLGIISLDAKDEIALINAKAQELLAIPKVKSWQLLKNKNTAFFNEISDLDFANHKLIELEINGQLRQLSVSISQLKLLGEQYRIITFKDIRNEISHKEIEAWHKLIRILTHEIMNSVTPIASLTESMMSQTNKAEKSSEDDELNKALATINHRAEGLLQFVSDYRKLTRVPIPKKEPIDPDKLVDEVMLLFQDQLHKTGISFQSDIQVKELFGDSALFDQVLINLVKNSIEAMEKSPTKILSINIVTESPYHVIEVRDTGIGISKELKEKVFIPFYSTKKEGSGIGLSLSRQILNLHGGYIDCHSQANEGTTFRLFLPMD